MAEDPNLIEGELDKARQRAPESRQDARELQAYREAGPPASPFDMQPAAFQQQIAQRGQNYRSLVDWLVENMVAGEDVVQVHVVKRDRCNAGGPPPRGSCTPTVTPGHWSAPDLSKKGAEKICGLLGLGTRFLGMDDFRRAALKGLTIEHVIIDCELYSSGRDAISQGTGACSLVETDGNLNAAMKRAAKRAHVDAVKRCAGLSGLATEIKQRMGPVDPDRASVQAETARQHARQEAGPAGRVGRWATGAKLKVCPIGKHEGREWCEIPTDYLEWAVKQWADKPDLVTAAAAELKARRRNPPPDASSSTHAQPPPSSDPYPDEAPFDDDIPF